MLKQSLVQEKISELALLNNRGDNKPSSSGASASAGEDSDQQAQLGSSSATVVEIRRNANTNSSSSSVNQTQTGMLPHIPQWPRLQIGTYSAHLLRTATLKSTPHGNLDLVQSPTTSNTKIGKNVGLNAAATTEEQRASIDFDGAETLNNYSSRSHLKFMGTNYSTSSNSGHGNSNKLDSGGGSDQNQNSNNPQVKFAARQQESDEDLARRNELAYDNTLKLKYLEKSIRFIQQQHSETLHGLHQEIEKLKNENRELHFKLATRRSSDSIKSEAGESKKAEAKPQQQEDVQQRKKSEATEKLRFDKMLKEVVRKEANLDNRLSDLKQMYELNRYDELLTRLKDAESKNEYLAKLVTQLEAKRSINSGFKPTAATTAVDNNANSSTKSTNGVKVISVEQIFSLEPLMVKTAENEEPRAPTSEESEILVKNLFALYKQQKQQIGNMKIVLRNVMQNEKLSNSAFVITKQTLDNSTPNKISNNSSARQYHSQTLNNTMVTEQTNANAAFGPINSLALTNQQQAGANPNLNVSSVVHLPPLQSSNYSRFPERLKRTQYLQKQRLRRDFFH